MGKRLKNGRSLVRVVEANVRGTCLWIWFRWGFGSGLEGFLVLIAAGIVDGLGKEGRSSTRFRWKLIRGLKSVQNQGELKFISKGHEKWPSICI